MHTPTVYVARLSFYGKNPIFLKLQKVVHSLWGTNSMLLVSYAIAYIWQNSTPARVTG